MFSQNKKGSSFMTKNQDIDPNSINLIGNGTSISGDIRSNGDVRIDGILSGSVSTKGKVVIGSTGRVEGEVFCQNADISGKLKGNISVQELLTLKNTAHIEGDIVSGKLSIEPGANFTGNCSMGGVVKDLNHATERDKKAEKTA